MGHYAFLNGCASRGVAERHETWRLVEEREPELSAKYRIPFLWLACFGPDDALIARPKHEGGHEETEDLLVLCAPVADVLARLARRRASVLRLIGPAFGEFYDEWMRFIRVRFGQCLLLRTADLFAMEGYEPSAVRMRAALRWLLPADAGQPIDEVAAIDWFCNVSNLFDERAHGMSPGDAAIAWRDHLAGSAFLDDGTPLWPAPPRPAEIAFAGGVREAAPAAAPGSPEAGDEAVARLVREGVQHDGTLRGGAYLALDKFTGAVPAGADAPTKTLRKLIGGGNELLSMITGLFGGGLLLLIGLVMFWAVARPPWSAAAIGIAAAITLLGAWGVRVGWRAWRTLRAIARA